jgi:hypothetical protein
MRLEVTMMSEFFAFVLSLLLIIGLVSLIAVTIADGTFGWWFRKDARKLLHVCMMDGYINAKREGPYYTRVIIKSLSLDVNVLFLPHGGFGEYDIHTCNQDFKKIKPIVKRILVLSDYGKRDPQRYYLDRVNTQGLKR